MSYSMGADNAWRDGYYTVSILQFVLVFILLLTLPLWKIVASQHQPQGIQDVHTETDSVSRGKPWSRNVGIRCKSKE